MAVDAAKAEWLGKVLGVALPARGGAAPGGMAAWQAARGAAIASLKALENAFRSMKEPEVDEAIILLRAIQANLTAAPETPQQVAELERYISTDDVIEEAEEPNGFGLTVDLRGPLLAALAELKAAQGNVR